MTASRDPDTILAAWLEDGPDALPESTRRAIVVTTRTIRQARRSTWVPWRSSNMNGMTRLALVAATVVVAAVGGLYLLGPTRPSGSVGGPASPTPTIAASASPLASVAPNAGAIRLTETGCAWDGNPGTMAMPALLNLRFRNETNDHGLFILHWVRPGHTWQEGVEYVDELQRLLATGAEWPPNDVSIAVAEHDVTAGEEAVLGWATSGIGEGSIEEFRRGGNWRWEPGTYGVICSANTSPTGDILTTFLVGPLQLAAAAPSGGPSQVP
jgi:hypothetical protein